jgi:hypothetical protein
VGVTPRLAVPAVSRGVPAAAGIFLGHLVHTWRIAAAFNGSGTFTEAIRKRLAANS